MSRIKSVYFDEIVNEENENVPYEYLISEEEWLEFNLTEVNFLLQEAAEMDKLQ
jgi:hypothetical protein